MNMLDSKNKTGFTLAEVLITLTVVGIVAVLTFPVLAKSLNVAQYRAELKKDISNLSQAARVGIAHFEADFASVNTQCKSDGRDSIADGDFTICGLMNNSVSSVTYIDDLFNYEIVPDKKYFVLGDIQEGSYHGLMYADGSIFGFVDREERCTQEDPCYGFIDVNGTRLPNKVVTGISTGDENTSGTGDDTQDSSSAENETENVYVPKDKDYMTDVYPIYFYGNTVVPATAAVRYILSTEK